MCILVIAEHDNASIKPATLNAVTAASKIGEEVHLLVAGHDCVAVAESAARIAGVEIVFLADAPSCADHLPENMVALIMEHAMRYRHIIAPATSFGKNFMPRVAARLDVAAISDVVEIISEDTFIRPIYAGSVLATVQSLDTVKVITVRSTAFASAEFGGKATIERIAVPPDQGRCRVIRRELVNSARPGLTTARVVVSGGRGLGSKEKFHEVLEPLADRLGAAVGASRAAIDAGFVSNELQVGQTGHIVAPDLYFAIGISGAIQHLAGMLGSRVIVAINKDAEAPIFQVADYGLVGDLQDIVPALISALG